MRRPAGPARPPGTAIADGRPLRDPLPRRPRRPAASTCTRDRWSTSAPMRRGSGWARTARPRPPPVLEPGGLSRVPRPTAPARSARDLPPDRRPGRHGPGHPDLGLNPDQARYNRSSHLPAAATHQQHAPAGTQAAPSRAREGTRATHVGSLEVGDHQVPQGRPGQSPRQDLRQVHPPRRGRGAGRRRRPRGQRHPPHRLPEGAGRPASRWTRSRRPSSAGRATSRASATRPSTTRATAPAAWPSWSRR